MVVAAAYAARLRLKLENEGVLEAVSLTFAGGGLYDRVGARVADVGIRIAAVLGPLDVLPRLP